MKIRRFIKIKIKCHEKQNFITYPENGPISKNMYTENAYSLSLSFMAQSTLLLSSCSVNSLFFFRQAWLTSTQCAIHSSVTDNCPSWISVWGRMTIEMISWCGRGGIPTCDPWICNQMYYCLCYGARLWTLVLLNRDIPCLCKQCRSRSVGFWGSQLIWICTVCHSVSKFMSTIQIK